MLVTPSNLQRLFTTFNGVFQNAFDTAPSDYGKIAMDVPSSTRSNTYGWLGQQTKFREWLGDRVLQSLAAHEFSIRNKSYENTIIVDRDDIADDNLGVYTPLIQNMGMDARTHPDELIFTLLKNAGATTCYDGQYFFSASHPVRVDEGTTTNASNLGGGASTAWYLFDVSRPIKPFIFQKRQDYKFVRMDTETDETVFMKKQFRYGVDCRVAAGVGLWQMAYKSQQTLTSENYQSARAAMMSLLGDNGKPLNIRPNLLVVPPSLEGDARELLVSERNASGASNPWYNSAQLLVTPWLV